MYFGRMSEMAIKIVDLWDDISDWSQETFGKDTDRGPIGALKHLQLEAAEAITSPTPDEMADCLILVFDAARRSGLTLETLIQAATAKQIINKGRTWPKPVDQDTPVLHIKEQTTDVGQ